MRPLLVLLLIAICGPLCAAPVTGLAFSPDGNMLASVAGNTLALRDPSTGEPVDLFAVENVRLTSLAFTPDSALLAVGGGTPAEKGELRLFDCRAKKWLEARSLGADLVTGVAFSPDGRFLAASSMEKICQVFRVSAQEPRIDEAFHLKGHSGPLTAVAFSPDGKTMVTTSLDRSLKVWSATDGAMIRTMGQHTDSIHCIAFRPVSPERREAPSLCVTGSDDRTVRVWQPTIGRMVRIVRRHSGAILTLVFGPDGRSIFSAGHEGLIRQIDADSDAILREWRASSEWIHCLAISPDGRTLASGDWMGEVTIHPASKK
jgi:WD40 repeat protein